jgi:hypothetical protein
MYVQNVTKFSLDCSFKDFLYYYLAPHGSVRAWIRIRIFSMRKSATLPARCLYNWMVPGTVTVHLYLWWWRENCRTTRAGSLYATHLVIVVDLLMADAAGVDGRGVGILWVEDHGLISWVDLLARHGEGAGPAHACAPEKTQTRKICINTTPFRRKNIQIYAHTVLHGSWWQIL